MPLSGPVDLAGGLYLHYNPEDQSKYRLVCCLSSGASSPVAWANGRLMRHATNLLPRLVRCLLDYQLVRDSGGDFTALDEQIDNLLSEASNPV